MSWVAAAAGTRWRACAPVGEWARPPSSRARPPRPGVSLRLRERSASQARQDPQLTSTDLEADLALAHALCDEADELTMRHFGAHDLRVETKPDHTPVTEADRAV